MLKRNTKSVPLAGGFFLAGIAVFYELLLHIWSGSSFAPAQLIPIALFGLGFGGLLGSAVCLIPSRKWEKWISVCAAVFLAVAYMTEFFLNECFTSFMPPSMIFRQAGGVATGFMDVILTLLVANAWKILLVLLPTLLFALWIQPRETEKKQIAIFATGALCAWALGFAALLGFFGNLSSLTDQFSFDSSVRRNGLSISAIAELSGMGSSAQSEEFVTVEMPKIPPVQVEIPTEDPGPESAPAEETEPPKPPKLHMLDIDFRSLGVGSGTIPSLNKYVDSQIPSTDNDYTGLFRGKNLILITAEAFTKEVIDPERTPTLYRLATKGIHFTDFYQPGWNGGTSGGEMSNISGLVPNPSCSMSVFSNQKPFITMGNQLQKLGYFSRAYHNNTGTFYDRNQTHTNLGYDQFIAMYSGMEEGVVNLFPQSDLEMIDFTVPQYIEHQPFSVYYMTVSGHSVYDRKIHAQAKKNYHLFEDSQWSEPVRCYLAANMELEYAMESLVRQLEQAGIADDTVIVLSADHYPYGLDAGSAWGHNKDYNCELFGIPYGRMDVFTRDHNAAIIWSGCLEDRDITVDTPAYSLDLLPTLCNLFDVEYDSRLLVGRDVFSDAMPLVLWPNYSWITELGRYSSETGVFTPNAGAAVPDGYVESVSAMVKNKINYSRTAISGYYFTYLQKVLDSQG